MQSVGVFIVYVHPRVREYYDCLTHHVKWIKKIGVLISITFEGNHGNVSNQSH
jgi:hypothetical protein